MLQRLTITLEKKSPEKKFFRNNPFIDMKSLIKKITTMTALLFLVMSANAASKDTHTVIEDMRLGIVNGVSSSTSWATPDRWDMGVAPGIFEYSKVYNNNGEPEYTEYYYWRVKFGVQVQAKAETTLYLDMTAASEDGSDTRTNIILSQYLASNHSYMPYILQSNLEGDLGLTFRVYTGGEWSNMGLNLLAFQNRRGEAGGYVKMGSPPESFVDTLASYTLDTNIKVLAGSSINRAVFSNRGQGPLTFSDGRTLSSEMMGGEGNGLYFETYSGLVNIGYTENAKKCVRYTKSGDINLDATINAPLQDVVFYTSTYWGYENPYHVLGGSQSNKMGRLIVTTNAKFAKQTGAVAVDASELIIEQGGSVTFENVNQVAEGVNLTFKKPVDPNTNLTGTLNLSGSSEKFGKLTISRAGKAPIVAVIDFGENTAAQTLYFDDLICSDSVVNQGVSLILKNYTNGLDHIYFKNKLSEKYSEFIKFEGYNGSAGAQETEDGYWEYLPDSFGVSISPDDIVGENENVTISANTDITPIQWYISKDSGKSWSKISGATEKSYSFVSNLEMDQYRYRCEVGSGDNIKTSTIVILSVLAPIEITQEPKAITVSENTAAMFEVKASGGAIKYQWQVSKDGGASWEDIEGANASVLNYMSPIDSNDYQFRCVLSNALMSVTSSSAGLSVVKAVVITTNPENQDVISGDTVSFTAEAENAISYQWQKSTDNANWTNIAGATSSTLDITDTSLKTSDNPNGYIEKQPYYFRCVFSNGLVNVPSESAKMIVYYGMQILQDLENCYIATGEMASFYVKVLAYKDVDITYKIRAEWYEGSTRVTRYYEDIVTKSPEYTFLIEAQEALETSRNNAMWYLEVVQNIEVNGFVYEKKVESKADAQIIIQDSPSITKQPENYYAELDGTAVFSVEAVGMQPLKYQWSYKIPDTTNWVVISGNETASTNKLVLENLTSVFNGYSYRVEVANDKGKTLSAEVFLYVNSPVQFEQQPKDVTIGQFGTATFSVVAKGKGPKITYQWQMSPDGINWENIAGATSPTYSLSDVSIAKNGFKFRCFVIDYLDLADEKNISSGYSSSAVLNVSPLPIITMQPTAVNIIEGSSVEFTVGVNGGRLSYQWQVSKDGGITWEDIPNAKKSTYRLDAAEYTSNGNLYRCAVSNPDGTVMSAGAVMNVSKAVIITKHAQMTTVYSGQTAVFSITATTPEVSISYQWQVYDGKEWKDVVGLDASERTNTLKIEATSQYKDCIFRCAAFNYMGIPTYSNPMTVAQAFLNILDSATVLEQPQDDYITAGEKAVFEIVAKGNNVKYQWQYSTGEVGTVVEPIYADAYKCQNCDYYIENLDEWVELPDDWVCPKCSAPKNTFVYQQVQIGSNEKSGELIWNNISGATSASLTVTPSDANSNYIYRCIVSNGGNTETSDTVRYIVVESVSIASDGQPQNTNGFVGSDVTLTVNANGSNLSFQWQKIDENGKWVDIEGATAYDLPLANVSEDDSGQYRCVVTNGIQQVISNPAVLNIYALPVITPENPQALAGDTVTLSVSNNDGVSYQWQFASAGSASVFTDISGATSSTLTINPVEISMNDNAYRCICVIGGISTESNIVTLKVENKIVAATQPSNQKVKAGETATFSLDFAGVKSYQWQKHDHKTDTWIDINGATSPTYKFVAKMEDDDTMYRCVMGNDILKGVVSDSVWLQVEGSIEVTSQPADATYFTGDSVTLSVSSTGATAYQWQKYNEETGTWEDVAGATSSTYSIASVTESDGGQYRCVMSNAGMSLNSSAVWVNVFVTPVITASAPAAKAGEVFTLQVQSYPNASYQWQYSSNGGASWQDASSTLSTLSFNASDTMNGYQYRCIVSTGGKTGTSASYTLKVLAPIVIQPMPEVVSVYDGMDVTLTVSASNATSYQWFYYDANLAKWLEIIDETSPTLTLEQVRYTEDLNSIYKCKVSNSAETVETNQIWIDIKVLTAVTPSVAKVDIGGSTTFTVDSIDGASYQWQRLPAGTINWIDVSAATTNSCTVSDITASMNGDAYRCKIVISSGTVYTTSGTLQVATDLSITYQTESQAVTVGDTAEFIVILSSEGTCQWQRSTNGGASWTNISGATNNICSVVTTQAMDGQLYRCKIQSPEGVNIYSVPATLTVKPNTAINITKQPEDISTTAGATAVFSVDVENSSKLLYQWQRSSDMVSWEDVAGANSTSLTLKGVGYSAKKTYYRCLISNGGSTFKATSVAYLEVNSEFAILENPVAVKASSGDSPQFTIRMAADSNKLKTYKWTVGSTANYYVESSYSNTSTLIISAEDFEKLRTCKVTCEVSISETEILRTPFVDLTYVLVPTLLEPIRELNYAVSGQPITLSVKATGIPELVYQWYEEELELDAEGNPTMENGNPVYSAPKAIKDAINPDYTIEDPIFVEQDMKRYFCAIGNVSGIYQTAGMYVMVTSPIAFDSQPNSTTLGLYGATTLNASVKIDDGLYGSIETQWQASNDGGATWFDVGLPMLSKSKNTNTSLNIKEASFDLNGYQYRVRARQIADGQYWNEIYSDAATLTVLTTASISKNPPASMALLVGSRMELDVEINGGSSTFQWQKSLNGGTTWVNIAGATSSKYVSFVELEDDGAMYRCAVITRASNPIFNIGGAVYSTPCKLTVGASYTFTQQPSDAGAVSGSSVSYTVAGTTEKPASISYQWQYYDGATWLDYVASDGSDKKATVNVKAEDSMKNTLFRCKVFSNSVLTAVSDGAWLKVTSKLEILEQPKTTNVERGATGYLRVSATGEKLAYQWKIFDSSTGNWNDVAGATSAELVVANVQNNATYRCVVSDLSTSASITSANASIVLVEKIEISGITEIVEAYDGASVTLKVTATNVTSYQWYIHEPKTDTWKKIDGATSASYTLTADGDRVNDYYRCELSNAAGSVTSKTMWLHTYKEVVITPVLETVKVKLGSTAVISMNVSGATPITYKWQRCLAGSSEWTDMNATGSSLVFVADDFSLDGSKYRCIASNGTGYLPSGTTATSKAVTLDIEWAPSIEKQPSSATVYEGESAEFTVLAVGEKPMTYQWQLYDGTVFKNIAGATSATLTIPNTSISDNGGLYICQIKNASGEVYSNSVTLTVKVAISGNASVKAGAPAMFSVRPSSDSTYQWQSKSSDSDSWSDVNGENSNSLTVSSVSTGMNGTAFRCLLTSTAPSSRATTAAVSDTATLNVSKTSYADWASTNGISGATSATPFGDGITNLERYTFNLDATKPTSYAGNSNFKYEYASDGSFEVTYPKAKYVEGIVVEVLYSYNMKDWNTGASATLVGETENEELYKVVIPASDENKKVFVKFKLTE